MRDEYQKLPPTWSIKYCILREIYTVEKYVCEFPHYLLRFFRIRVQLLQQCVSSSFQLFVAEFIRSRTVGILLRTRRICGRIFRLLCFAAGGGRVLRIFVYIVLISRFDIRFNVIFLYFWRGLRWWRRISRWLLRISFFLCRFTLFRRILVFTTRVTLKSDTITRYFQITNRFFIFECP